VKSACERLSHSHEAVRARRGARVRFTCQEANGHVVESTLVPSDSLAEYEQNCRRYLAANEPLRDGTADVHAHFAALRAFVDANNQLTHQSVDQSNALWRQERTDRASLNRLVKERGGSIEITN
jgi:hypothetical protein